MKTFQDNAGRTWTIAINVDAIKRVRDLLAVNLLEVIEGKLIDQLTNDPILLCDVLFAVCKPEADAKKISDSDFGQGMAGDAIDAATAALLEDLVDFFPPARRQVLQRAIQKLATLRAEVTKRVLAKLDSGDLDREVLRQLDQSSALSGSAQAASESTPAL